MAALGRCHALPWLLGGAELDGVRPSAVVIARLRQGLAREGAATAELQRARVEIRAAVVAARAEGAGYFQIASAIVPATGEVAETTRRRERMAGNLRARMFEASRR